MMLLRLVLPCYDFCRFWPVAANSVQESSKVNTAGNTSKDAGGSN